MVDVRDLVENQNCFDLFVEFDEVSIKSWLKENAGSIIIVDTSTKVMCYLRRTIKKFLSDPNYILLKCIGRQRNNHNPDEREVLKFPTQHGEQYVFADQMKRQCVLNKSARIFQIVGPSEHWHRSESKSRRHHGNRCLSDSGIDIYSVQPLFLEDMFAILGGEEAVIPEEQEIRALNFDNVELQSRKLSLRFLNNGILVKNNRSQNSSVFDIYKTHPLPFVPLANNGNSWMTNIYNFFSPSSRYMAKPGLQMMFQSIIYDVGETKYNAFLFQSNIQDTLDYFRQTENVLGSTCFVMLDNMEPLFPNSVLSTKWAVNICLFQIDSAKNGRLIHKAIINFLNIDGQDQFVTQFDSNGLIEGESAETIYSSKSFPNLLRFAMWVLHRNHYVSNEPTRVESINTSARILKLGDEFTLTSWFLCLSWDNFNTNVKFYSPSEWAEEKEEEELNIISADLRDVFQAMSFTSVRLNNMKLQQNDFKIYESTEEAIHYIQNDPSPIVFAFVSHLPTRILDQSVLLASSAIYLCCYVNINLPNNDLPPRTKTLYSSTIFSVYGNENRSSVLFVAQADQDYFSDELGVMDPTIYTSNSLLNLIRFFIDASLERQTEEIGE
jgi:hypothetical protein